MTDQELVAKFEGPPSDAASAAEPFQAELWLADSTAPSTFSDAGVNMTKEPSAENAVAVAEPILGVASATALVTGDDVQTTDPIDEEARNIFIRTVAGLPDNEIVPSALQDQLQEQQE